jgi:hypothetical protein
VYANGFTVTIDQDVVANSLNIVAGTTAVQGGAFQCSTTRTIALQQLQVGLFSGASAYLLLLSAGSVTLTVAGTMSGDGSSGGAEPRTVSVTGGTHTITAGTCVGGLSPAIEMAGGLVTFTGDVDGGTLSQPAIALASGGAQLTVHGTVTGGTTAVGIQVTSGTLRLDAELVYGPTGVAPVNGGPSAGGIVFMRDGANLAVTAPSDDDWPGVSGAPLTLTEGGGGGGVDPKRYLLTGAGWVPIQ